MRTDPTGLSNSPSPLGTAIKLAVIVLLTELLIMLSIEHYLHPLFDHVTSPLFWVFLDALLLTLCLGPLLYFSVLRPLRAQQSVLSMQKSRMDAIFDNSQDAIVTMDKNGRITGWSAQADITFGWSANAVMGLLLHETIIPERYRERHRKGLEHFLATGEANMLNRRVELTALHRDRHEFPVELSVAQIDSANGIEFSAFIRDISERKQHEQEIRHNETRFRQLFENMSSAVAIYRAVDDGTDFIFTDFNHAAEQIENYSRDEIIGKRLTAAFPSVREFGLLDVLQRVWRTGQPEHFPIAFYQDERISGWRNNYLYRLPSDEVVAIYDDMTQDKQNEQALRNSEARYRALIDQAADALFVFDLDGRFVEVNHQACASLGYDADELLQMSITDITPGYDITDRKPLWATFEVGKRYSISASHQRKDGSIFPVDIHIVVLDVDQQKLMMALVSDITERKRFENQLRESEAHLKSIFDTLSEGVALNEMIFDDAGEMVDYRILEVNPAFYTVADFNKDVPVIGQTATTLYGMDSEMIKSFWHAHRNVTETVTSEMLSPISQRWFSISTSPFADHRFVTTFRDITERKQKDRLISQWSDAFNHAALGIALGDVETGRVVVGNHAFARMLGRENDEIPGFPILEVYAPSVRPKVQKTLANATRKEGAQFESLMVRKDGSEFPAQITLAVIKGTDGVPLYRVATLQDITEKKQAEERIEELSHFDQLTGLPNHSLLNDHFKFALSLAQRSNEQLAVIYLDLDHFKHINETLGHATGDRLLIEIAKRLKVTLRAEDTVSRQGGDEFIMILPGTDANGAAHVAEKLTEAISKPCYIDERELSVTPSIGIAIYPDNGENMESLLRNADNAMYQAKQDGRNHFRFFTPEMQVMSARNLMLSNALRHALERNEMSLHYQPQFSVQDGRIIGAEALLRWRHPELGMVSPAEFIPIAEDTGQILQIGEWVLRTAVRQLKNWMEDGVPQLVMAVNLSAAQFRQKDLTELVTSILAEMQLPHECLELELTEATMMKEPQKAISVMNQLHELGIRMSIDDFGTGYSSLSYLKQFNVYKLKIDQSFVRDLTDDPEDKAIVTAIINMATSLGMQTIAEGVETASQLAFLRLQGCNEVQGYYFSRPLTAEQFREYVDKH